MGKKGFTLIEVLVVVVFIAIVSMIAFPSYKKAKAITANDAARVKLLELATAVMMYNEADNMDNSGKFHKVAGDFDGNRPSVDDDYPYIYDSLMNLFDDITNNQNNTPYLANKDSWYAADGVSRDFNGYQYIVCVRESGVPQPNTACNTSRVAVMILKSPLSGDHRYNYDSSNGTGLAWVSWDDPGKVQVDYDMKKDVSLASAGV